MVPVIAIDGPGGSGKGTVARLVARRLGWHLLDSGALYRLVALAGMRKNLASDDVAGVIADWTSVPSQKMRLAFASSSDGD